MWLPSLLELQPLATYYHNMLIPWSDQGFYYSIRLSCDPLCMLWSCPTSERSCGNSRWKQYNADKVITAWFYIHISIGVDMWLAALVWGQSNAIVWELKLRHGECIIIYTNLSMLKLTSYNSKELISLRVMGILLRGTIRHTTGTLEPLLSWKIYNIKYTM